jgi:DnaK suppressor protein
MSTTDEAGLTESQREALKQKLIEARTAITARRAEQLRARTGLISEVEDEADQANRAGNEDALVLLAESEHDRLFEIDHALAKFETGDYGLDEETDEPIGYARLDAVPWARYSVQTQEAQEAQARSRRQ